MVGYPESAGDRRVDAAALRHVVEQVFQRCSMSTADATLLADTLVTADLRGVHSHGVLRVGEYVIKLTTGGVDPAGRPRVIRDHGAALVVDCGNSMGQIGSTFSMQSAMARANETGVAVAAAGGSNHCGALDYYAMMAVRQDMIGLVTTNALPTMAPWGGSERLLGINPLSVAIPSGQEPMVVFDAAFSASSHGKIRVFHQKGLSIPSGWATDAEGRPTTDPAAAIQGLLLPIGGHKGTGLALVMGVLSTLLSGASFGTELGNMSDGPRAGADGHFFLAINIAAFTDVTPFKSRMDAIIHQCRTSRPAPDGEQIYLPGQREAEAEILYRQRGIPLSEATRTGLCEVAGQLGVDAASIC